METITTSRRGILGRAAVLAAGALGLTAGGTAAEASLGGRGRRLYGRSWHAHVPGGRFGTRPEAGANVHVHGELLDGRGNKLGEFHGAVMPLSAPFGHSDVAPMRIETHTFTFTDGTILGMGSAFGERNVFGIVGGTGRYAGARGTYHARQSARGLGGDGTAEFVLDLKV